MKKNIFGFLFLIIITFSLFTKDNNKSLILTIEELMTFDGTNNKPVYIAINGIIYDVTDLKEWQSNEYKKYGVAKDLTNEFTFEGKINIPDILTDTIIVGKLVKAFTLDELSKYNGTDGKVAYVAIKTIVYDVTNIKSWAGGKHKGNKAGRDVTYAITKKSPHGLKALKKLNIIGKIVDKKKNK